LLAFSARAAESESWPRPLPDHDPVEILQAFIQADAWGLQTGGSWQLVMKFTTWEDGPGWDSSSIIESAQIVAVKRSGARAEIGVRYRKLGDLGTDGEGLPTLDVSAAGVETITFTLEDRGLPGARRWKIVGPQDGPRLSVGYAFDLLLPKWCARRDCRKNPAYQFLKKQQVACAASSIEINRSCGRGKGKT
jgi:hypothetical protein